VKTSAFTSYVAIGDSLSEGLGDFGFEARRENCGWTDRLAAMLSLEANRHSVQFRYANLALRGSKLSRIMTDQLEAALRLQPDLVTIMAGSNDMFASEAKLPALEETFRSGLQLLIAAGCQVVVANTISPRHLRVFSRMAPRAERLTRMLERVAAEFDIKVIDVHGIESFAELCYWAEDMVHFSGHGHIKVANRAAEVLGLNHRMPEAHPNDLEAPSRTFWATLSWVRLHVIPFIGRRIQRKSSGDGMQPKHLNLVPFSNTEFEVVAFSELALSDAPSTKLEAALAA
jgi:lysophospholipase L1-like esterase